MTLLTRHSRGSGNPERLGWIPAFAGMTVLLLLALPVRADEAPRQITVTGQAEKSFLPDKADVTVVLEGRGKFLAEAKRKHDELLNALHEVTAKFGIKKDKVKTLSDSINPQYDYVRDTNGDGKQVLRGYSAEHRLRVTLTDLDEIGDFINALVAKKIDRVEQVSYGLQNSDEAELEVGVMAVRDARTKAQHLLAALDAGLGKVLSVSMDNGGYAPRPMPMMAMAKMESSQDAAAPVPQGEVTIRQNVSVQFEIQ